MLDMEMQIQILECKYTKKAANHEFRSAAYINGQYVLQIAVRAVLIRRILRDVVVRKRL